MYWLVPNAYERCVYCSQALDFSRATIVTGLKEPSYVPFAEDWRGGITDMAHPKCFAEAEGLDRFLEVLARHDERQRQGFAELRRKLIQRRHEG
jgi:hypothetical protein